MANTFTGACQFNWNNGVVVANGASTYGLTMTGNQSIQNIQNVGTVAESIELGDVVPGMIWFQNLDATNYVDIGTEATALEVSFKLAAGQGVLVPTSNATWHAKANTAAVDLLVIACDA